MTQLPWVAMQRAFVMLTPEGDQAVGWPGIPQLTCTCKEAASALKSARKELAPAFLAALQDERNEWDRNAFYVNIADDSDDASGSEDDG